ncbi:hypothetical protein GCM10010329_62360 [Streptomyces spiroverticillatus]|uniref:Uncharacterized protein n=1 Tax=Streptomyces finlayi TaxID=67296 RepID=A0A918X5Y7_9ACTN|nr:hypothetical protein GCM10010329_62360 [Streptomyces spiroverticillatus]GHD14717.1 hypothetical protein GCM10010334_74070 [Streptomyces finlayi]
MLVAAAVPHHNNSSGHSGQQPTCTGQDGKARAWFRRRFIGTFRPRQSASEKIAISTSHPTWSP